MATRLVLRLSILLGLLAVAANARPGRHFHPCKTLIFLSTSSSAYPFGDFNSFPQNPGFIGRRSVTVYFNEIRQPDPTPSLDRTFFVDRPTIVEEEKEDEPFPFRGIYSSVGASFRDRTKDILRVVGSLLFGVGCGALTAATLYLIWSLFAENRFDYQEYDEDFDSDDDASPKKVGYVAIPAEEKPAPAKEVV